MNAKIFLALLLACASFHASASGGTEEIDAKTIELIYRLAERPVGVVSGDRCEIRGAIWANGPYPHAKQSLINVVTGEVHRTTTNSMGVYSLSIPYSGTPLVLAERIDDEIYVRKEFADTAKVINGGVVCDHRLKTEIAQTRPQQKETK